MHIGLISSSTDYPAISWLDRSPEEHNHALSCCSAPCYYCHISLINSSLHSEGGHCPTLPRTLHSDVTFTECLRRWQKVLIPVTCTRLDISGDERRGVNSISPTVDQHTASRKRHYISLNFNLPHQYHSECYHMQMHN